MSDDKKIPSFKGYIEDKHENDHKVVGDKMRKAGLPVEHTMFATIHHQSDDRPDGYSQDELDGIAKNMIKGDVKRWKSQLQDNIHKNVEHSPVETGAYSDNGNDEGVSDYDDVGFDEQGSEDH